jgi:hypothetical protein
MIFVVSVAFCIDIVGAVMRMVGRENKSRKMKEEKRKWIMRRNRDKVNNEDCTAHHQELDKGMCLGQSNAISHIDPRRQQSVPRYVYILYLIDAPIY